MAESKTDGVIVVAGVGRVAIVPDVAHVRLGVTVSRDSVIAARADAATAMTTILGAIRGAGVAPRDVQTAALSVQPRYDYRDGRAPRLVGYDLSNVVSITIRDLASVATVIDGALQAGATSLDSLSFDVDDPTEPEREAREAAVRAARARADTLAGAAGLRVSGVESIVEGGSSGPIMPMPKGGRMMLAADTATPVEAGTADITVTVTVTYRVTPLDA